MTPSKLLRHGLAPLALLLIASAVQAQGAVDNPYGVASIWEKSDIVARAVLFILVAMSAGSWYVIITKLLQQARLNAQARAAQKDFWAAGTVKAGRVSQRSL